MSAMGSEADICNANGDVRFGPIADKRLRTEIAESYSRAGPEVLKERPPG